MTLERILGGTAVLIGGFLLLYAIPANVVSVEGILVDPALFPQLAAWMLIGLGLIQIISSRTDATLPPLREVARLGLVSALTLAAILLMNTLGYLITAVALMAALQALVYERRIHWLLVSVAAMPIAIWLFFEILLKRPLP